MQSLYYRTTSKLANPPSLDGHSTAHFSLPTFTSLPPPPKPALYGRPSMELNDLKQLLQPEVVRFSCTELLLAYVRLCLACVKLHKGVINRVSELVRSLGTHNKGIHCKCHCTHMAHL